MKPLQNARMMNEKNEKVKHCTHCQRKEKWISFVPFNYKENQARQKKPGFFYHITDMRQQT